MDYPAAKAFILRQLENDLSDHLFYHGVHHTLDVLQRSIELCEAEQVGAYETNIVKTAALYHDCGFLESNIEHERLGCEIANRTLPQFHYSTSEIEIICGMIRATKVPQNPQNHFEAILCDADLDYLGRDDFKKIGTTLFEELKVYKILESEEEWNRMQVTFLQSHTFFTKTNQKHRDPKKQKHLDELKKIVAGYEKNEL